MSSLDPSILRFYSFNGRTCVPLDTYIQAGCGDGAAPHHGPGLPPAGVLGGGQGLGAAGRVP